MQTSVSTNRKNENPCMNHLGEPLIASAPRKGLFEFIKQDDVESTERWLGFFSNDEINAGHSHSIPIESKMD